MTATRRQGYDSVERRSLAGANLPLAPMHPPANSAGRVAGGRPLHGPPLILPVLGVPTRFRADEPRLRRIVLAAFGSGDPGDGRGHEGASDGSRDDPQPHVRLALTAAGSGSRAAERPVIRTRPGGRLLFLDPGRIAGRASLRSMRAELRVAPDALRDERAITDALDTLTLFLVTRLDRQPVHGAAVAAGERALVLTGPSGAGKSTLAYAAHRAGLRVLADDIAFVQLAPRFRVRGLGRPLHLAPDAREWFPELRDRPLVRRANGKRKIEVPLDRPPAENAAGPAGLCLLGDRSTTPGAESIPPDRAVALLEDRLEPGFDAFRDTIGRRLRALAAGGAWIVRPGERPDATVPVLLDLLDRVGR